jgi:hypothetical protein
LKGRVAFLDLEFEGQDLCNCPEGFFRITLKFSREEEKNYFEVIIVVESTFIKRKKNRGKNQQTMNADNKWT